MLPWQYFGLTPRDLTGELIRVWNQARTDNVLAGSSPVAQIDVPSERAALITHVSCTANLAGDQPIRFVMLIQDLNVPAQTLFTMFLPLVRSTTLGLNIFTASTDCFVMAGPSQRIFLQIETNTQLGVQLGDFGMAGFLLPRGDATYL